MRFQPREEEQQQQQEQQEGSVSHCTNSSIKTCFPVPLYNQRYPQTPADSKGERVREERLWTTTNTTTGLGKLSKVAAAVAAAEQRQW